MNNNFKEGKRMKNRILTFIIGVFVGSIIATIGFFIYIKVTNRQFPPRGYFNGMQMQPRERGEMRGMPFEEVVEKETTADDIEFGEEVIGSNIDLGDYSSNITITKGGEYILKGGFTNAILVNSDNDVTLVLDGVSIENNVTAAIANIGKTKLTLKLSNNSKNILKDGGSSEYDACIYSNGPLVIEGNGELEVYGNQEEGEGIATETNDMTINGGKITIECKDDGINAGGDGGVITINGGDVYIKASGDGIDSNKDLIISGGSIYTIGSSIGGDAGIDTDGKFVINGGNVTAIGSDMLQTPDTTSNQKSACFTLNEKISQGTKVSIKKENEKEIVSFEAKEDFRTLIISNSLLTSGTYYLYQNGEKTSFSATVK